MKSTGLSRLTKADDALDTGKNQPHSIEDWVALALFWAMALCVFLQFFTRYVLNNSLAWTEEIAANLLIVTVMFGAAICTRISAHIRVDFLYRVLPRKTGRLIALAVDLMSIAVLGWLVTLFYRFAEIAGRQRLVTVDVSRSWVYYAVVVAIALMTIRAVVVFVTDLRRGTCFSDRAPDQVGGNDA